MTPSLGAAAAAPGRPVPECPPVTSVAEAPPETAVVVTVAPAFCDAAAAIAGGLVPYRLSVAKYEEIVHLGILGPGDKVELLHGMLASKMGTHTPHAFATTTLMFLLYDRCRASWCVRSQQPVIVPDDSMPEPDVSVAPGSQRDYLKRHPTAEQTALVVEVSDSSLRLDLGGKLALYAAALIPEYWVVDLPGQKLHVHTLPYGGERPGYRNVAVLGIGDEVPLTLRGESFGTLRVADFLPPLNNPGDSS